MRAHLEHFNLEREPFPDISEDEAERTGRLSEKETGAYIRRRLRLAGTTEQVFDAGAIRRVYTFSEGNTKLIHQVCRYALQLAAAKETEKLRQELMDECLDLLLQSRPADDYPNDKRRHKRIATHLTGSYVIEGTKLRGQLTVTDLSRSGARLKLNRQRVFKTGDRVIVSFHMDDDQHTPVRNFVTVRNTFGFYAGCAFTSPNTDGFYNYISTKAAANA